MWQAISAKLSHLCPGRNRYRGDSRIPSIVAYWINRVGLGVAFQRQFVSGQSRLVIVKAAQVWKLAR
jgi:hypothetical protein